jgi:hypothetical protein
MAKKKVETFQDVDIHEEVISDGKNTKSLTSLNNIVSEIKEISLDNTVEDVVKWNKEGYRLRFNHERFLELPEETVRELFHENARDYFFSLGLWKKVEDQKKRGVRRDPKDPKIEILGGSASGRVQFKNKQPGMHYTAKRPDEIYEALDAGYVVCDSTDPVIFGDRGAGGVKAIHGRKGEKELIALKISEDRYQAHLRAVGEESRRRIQGEGEAFKKEGRKYGIKTEDKSYHHYGDGVAQE